jgi:hypothetical protein
MSRAMQRWTGIRGYARRDSSVAARARACFDLDAAHRGTSRGAAERADLEPGRVGEQVLRGLATQLRERHPVLAQRRAIRVEHHQVAVEHEDDVLDLVHEAPHALQLAHVGERPVAAGELGEPALQRLAALEIGLQEARFAQCALVAVSAGIQPARGGSVGVASAATW